jgi:hypothetical protein
MDSYGSFIRLKSRLWYATLSLLLTFGVGCSNPLSSGQAGHIQDFHSKNVNCDQINFSDATFSVDRIRELTHCLNTHNEIDALDNLLSAVPDSDLQPVADFINIIISEQPKYLFALKETYDHAKTTGDLSAVEKTLSDILADSQKNAAVVEVAKKVSTPLTNFIFDRDVHGNLSSIYVMLRSIAFQRLGNENFQANGLNNLLLAVAHYAQASDAQSLDKLYGYLANNNLDATWTSMIATSEQAHVRNIAHFFEWLVSNGRYALLSSSIHQMTTEPVTCFNGGSNVKDALAGVIPTLTRMSAADVTEYFKHDIKNLYLTGQGYCQFPFSAGAAMKLAEEAVAQPGFAETWSLVGPLLNDPNFVSFLGSSASSQFMTALAPFTSQHFFEDFFTLITLHLQNPITTNGAKVAVFLDSSLKSINDADVNTLISFLSPVLNANEAFAAKLTKKLYSIGFGFPALSPTLTDSMRSGLMTSVRDFIWRPELSPVLDLGASLINSAKLDGLIDQALTYLQAVFQRGSFAYQPPLPKDPSNATLPSARYLIEKLGSIATVVSPCDSLVYDWTFSSYTAVNSASYLKEIASIQTCIDPNQTFAAAKDLITYSITAGKYPAVLSAQNSVVTTLFKTDADLTFSTLNDFLAINQGDSDTIGKILNLGSASFALIETSYLAKNDFRKTVANFISNPATYQAIAELTGPKPTRLRSSTPTLDLPNLKTVNAFISKDKSLTAAPIADALAAMMTEYCPSLDITNADCAIDPDQVTLYKQSPTELFAQIAEEELTPAQSFLHPTLSTGWTHHPIFPSQVSMFEYHLNPTLHLMRQQPQSPRALLTAVARGANDGISLNRFLQDRATRVLLIPYYYEVPNFPSFGAREYHDHIRIRILNDLDRLELIAINADFKAFGVVSNIGMGFLRSIAFAWGDVPVANRPSTLSKFVAADKVLTLKEVKEQIESEMAKYDRQLLTSLGQCNPSSHNPIARWFITGPCKQLSDVSARIFNLRALIPLLQTELPVADGGNGGLIFLRDLFYSLYEANTDSQRNQFADGELLGSECLQNPLDFSVPLPNCQKDLLTVVSRVAHLGLLHEAGTSILQAKDNPISSVTSIIDRVVADPELNKQFVNSFSSDQGLQFLTDSVTYGFQSPIGTGKNLSMLAQLASIPKDLTWVNLAFEMIPKDMHFPSENQALIDAFLSIDSKSLDPWLDHWLADPKLPTPALINLLSQKLTPAVRNDLLTLLVELEPNSGAFAKYLVAAKNLPDLDSGALKKDVSIWATRFADPSMTATRANLSDWTLAPDFNQFCDVFSDSTLVSKAYNFLESINQNPDSKTFIDNAKQFIDTH